MSKAALLIQRGSEPGTQVLPPLAPPSVTTGAATAITSTTATLNGVVNPNGAAVSNYHFTWGPNTAMANSTSSGTLVSGSANVAVTRNISGLTAGQVYYYRLLATNSEGTTAGTMRQFTATGSVASLITQMGWTDASVAYLDPATQPNVVIPWSFVTNGYEWTSTAANYDHNYDESITTFSSGGDPSPGFDGVSRPGRRWLTTEGPIALYDAPSGYSTRNQVGGISLNDRPYTFRAGERVALSMSVKLQSPSPLTSTAEDVDQSAATAKFSQVWQYKSVNANTSGQQSQPLFQLAEGSNGVRLGRTYDGNNDYWGIPASRGIWLRLLFDVLYSTSAVTGKFRMYADLTEGPARNYTAATPLITDATIRAGSDGASMNWGAYHTLESNGGLPRHEREYGAIEIIEHATSDPW